MDRSNHIATMALSAVVAAVGLLTVAPAGATTIFKCEREDGTIEFSQSPCAPPTEQITLRAAKSGVYYEISEGEADQRTEPGLLPGEVDLPPDVDSPQPAPAEPTEERPGTGP